MMRAEHRPVISMILYVAGEDAHFQGSVGMLENVRFTYPEADKPALRGISLQYS